MESNAPDGLFDEALLERVVPDATVIEAGAGIHKRFKPFDPGAVMMVPLSLDERLPETHLARFIADLVETELDLSRFYAAYGKAKGQPPYDPRLMVRVLLYGYCVGCVPPASWSGPAWMWSRSAGWLGSVNEVTDAQVADRMELARSPTGGERSTAAAPRTRRPPREARPCDHLRRRPGP